MGFKIIRPSWPDSKESLNCVSGRIFVLNMDEFIKIQTDPSIKTWFTKGKFPPSTLIEVTRLSNPDFLIEIDLLAVT